MFEAPIILRTNFLANVGSAKFPFLLFHFWDCKESILCNQQETPKMSHPVLSNRPKACLVGGIF
jgi:hypothetical protein